MKKSARSSKLLKVLFLGDNNIGKTSFIRRYMDGTFSRTFATIGVDFALKVVQWSPTETVRLQLWDIAGQERFASMTRLYYKEAAACVIMFDITDRGSFLGSQKWKEDLDSKVTLPNGSPVPCILLANKCDLSNWAVTKDEIDDFSKANKFIGWTETSVKENKNVNESMRVLLEMMMNTGECADDVHGKGDYINLHDIAKPDHSCC